MLRSQVSASSCRFQSFPYNDSILYCHLYRACAQRAQTHYGTSRLYPRCLAKQSMKDYLSAESHHNPLTYNWNVVHVKYCDGTSYSSSADVVYEVSPLLNCCYHSIDSFLFYYLGQEIVLSWKT